MGITTSQQISQYYDYYRDTNIIFSREILKVLRIDPRQIYIKCNGVQWACIINSSSLMQAKIIIGTKGGAYAAIQKINTPVSLRFYFIDSYGKPMSLFVNCRVSEVEAYMDSNDLAIATLDFNSKPPDDLIEILGKLLEANSNYVKRSEERIIITPDSMRQLNLVKKETQVFIEKVPRNCIIRDLSFKGAKVLMMGLAQFLQNKETILRLTFEDPAETLELQGQVVQVENIEGRKDLVAFSMHFHENKIPITYKIHINKYLTSFRKKLLNASEEETTYADKKADAPTDSKKDEPNEQAKEETQGTENTQESENNAQSPNNNEQEKGA